MRVRHGQRALVIWLSGNGMPIKNFPWRGLLIGLAIGLVFALTTGCSGNPAKDTIKVINATKHLSKDGLVSNMYECAYDALDTNNRGSGCHRSK